jgi:SWI/SNF-related matrix-associated actin-dependent regulator of chromatin subfamily A3
MLKVFPQDRRPVTSADLIEPSSQTLLDMTQAQRGRLADEQLEMDESDEPSAKIDQLMKLLSLLPRSEKSLVFSTFTSFLDMVATRLKSAG